MRMPVFTRQLQTRQGQMIAWTLAAVFLVGAGVVASVLQPPSTIKRDKVIAAEALVEITGGAGEREPASEGPQFSALSIDDKGSQAIDFTLPCADRSRFSRNVVQVRLSGGLCGSLQGAIESSEIRNATNGFSATVFPGTREDTFTTDYITLASGENHIRIQHILKSGAKIEREFVIER